MTDSSLSLCLLYSTVYVIVFFSSDVESTFELKLVNTSEAGLVFYYGPTYDYSQYYNLSDALSLPAHPSFIQDHDTHVYIHGYGENQKNESILVIVDAYLSSKRPINLVTVDYGKLVDKNYISAMTNMIQLAPVLADTFLELFADKLDKSKVTLVGHSLGAQLAGYVGREIKRKSNNQTSLEVIWGLDPAFPGFLPQDLPPFSKTLDKNDADFVPIIHTNAPNYNLPLALGHVDFYPNGGLQGQPGCPSGFLVPFSKDDLCSHQISWRFWAEGIKYLDEPKFHSFPASSYLEFLLSGALGLKCDTNTIMGIECPVTARGKYYLQTNPAPRYARGVQC